MATTVRIPSGMTILQTLHALMIDQNCANQAYNEKSQRFHELVNTSNLDLEDPFIQAYLESALNEGRILKGKEHEIVLHAIASHIDAFARNRFSKRQFCIGSVHQKPVHVSFANFPNISVGRYDKFLW